VHQPRLTVVLVVAFAGLGCAPKGGTQSPNVIESAASDVEHEVDQADETAEQVGEDVGGAAEDAVDAVDG
jgi:hypothetical protein